MRVRRIHAHHIVGHNQIPLRGDGLGPIGAEGAIGPVKVVTGELGGLSLQQVEVGAKENGDHPGHRYSKVSAPSHKGPSI